MVVAEDTAVPFEGNVVGLEEGLYVLVCKELHQAIGPIVGLDLALRFINVMNSQSECVFVPVRMFPLFDSVEAVGEVSGGSKLKKLDGKSVTAVDDRKGYL